jgi:type IV fimbrial biogenesis protein FimT
MFSPKGPAGFTLLELMIVLTVVGLMASIALPRMGRSQTRFHIQAARAELIQAHALTRATAMRWGRTAELQVNTVQKTFWVQVDTGGASPLSVGRVHTVGGGLSITSTATRFCFDARGMRTSRNGCGNNLDKVILSGPQTADTVQITALGELKG